MRALSNVDLDALLLKPEQTILDAMKTIDRCGMEVALICDSAKRLLAVVTDGDIRRALINGCSLDRPVAEVGNRLFTALPANQGRTEAVQIMVEKGIKALPVVDAFGRVTDLHTLHGSLMGQRKENWAVIMAGGKGERLGELTHAIPKPMLPVGDRPILERIVQLLVGHGIRRVFISVNHYGRMIEDHFGDGSRFFCKIDYLHEMRPLGTGGALALLPERPTHPVVVMNGDLITGINVSRMLAFHDEGSFAATMAVRSHKVTVPFGVAELNESRVAKLVEKPSLNYFINAGIYAISPDAIDLIPKDRAYPITDLFNHCLKTGQPVGAYHLQEYWSDVGLPEEFNRVQVLCDNEASAIRQGAARSLPPARVAG